MKDQTDDILAELELREHAAASPATATVASRPVEWCRAILGLPDDLKHLQRGAGVEPLYLTNSSSSTFMDCPFKYWLEYECRYSPKKDPIYFVWGDMVHRIAEGRETGVADEQVIHEIRTKLETLHPSASELLQYEGLLHLLPFVADIYEHYYQEELGQWEILETEKFFELDIGNNVFVRGKIDAVKRFLPDGRIKLVERKTPGRTGPTYFERLQWDTQLLTYVTACNYGLGYHVEDVLYDVWQKPQAQQQTKMTEPGHWAVTVATHYRHKAQSLFQRWPLHFDVGPTAEKMLRHYHSIAHLIRECRETGTWIKHHPGNRNGRCSFETICLNPTATDTVKQRTVLNPELGV